MCSPMVGSGIGSSAPPLNALLSLHEGDLLASRYRIESLVGTRSTGVHFAATDLTSGTRVSVHVLVAPAASDTGEDGQDSARVAFLAGARRAKVLTSPHVARILDAGVTADGHPWVVREHLGSNTLAAHLRERGAIGTREAVDIALAVCDVIAEAHAHDILHLSLGPHAVHAAWSASGLVDIKVTGTGTAAAEAALALDSASDVECILRAPEQLRTGSHVDGRADVWAIAVLLHTMLGGAPPFSADTPSGVSLSVIIDDPPSLAGVPDELADIVERALARDREQRPRDVLDLAESLVLFSSHPDIARDRIARRRGRVEVMLPAESAPTLVVDRHAYDALAREQSAAKDGPAVPTVPPSSVDVLVDVAPSVRELPEMPPSRPEVPTLAPMVQPAGIHDLPTHTARQREATFPRRQAFTILGLMAAAACVALLVVIGTEGAPLSKRRPPAIEGAPAAVTVVAPVPPATEPPAAAQAIAFPADTATAMATVSSPAALPQAPRPNAMPATASRNRVHQAAPASPDTPPPSKPSPSGSADDLRRFLDDRR